jgi:hypothetical protein
MTTAHCWLVSEYWTSEGAAEVAAAAATGAASAVMAAAAGVALMQQALPPMQTTMHAWTLIRLL